jgi:hypothetical protein
MLLGTEIRQALAKMDVSASQFVRLTGVNEKRLSAQLLGRDDGDIPLYYELVLYVLYHHPEMRTWKGPIDLPFEEWGIDIEVVDSSRS